MSPRSGRFKPVERVRNCHYQKLRFSDVVLEILRLIMTNYVNLHGDPTGSRAILIPGMCGRAFVSSDLALPARPHPTSHVAAAYLSARRNAQGRPRAIPFGLSRGQLTWPTV
jgi:hypothetical protein